MVFRHPIARQGFLTGIFGIFFVASLWGCNPNVAPIATQPSQTNPAATAERRQKMVLTTFTVIADLAQNVAGDKAIVRSIVKPGAEIHSYEPTPSDFTRAKDAVLIFDNGLNLERWADRFYNSLPQVPRFTVSSGVQAIDIEDLAYFGKPNPHAWMSPRNALVYVENIRQSLNKIDPENAATYNANAKAYSQKIQKLDGALRRAIEAIPPSQRYLVSCEGAFSYLARDYGLKEAYIWPVNSESQATPKQIAKVIATVKAKQIPAVFCESTANNEAQLQIARETGAKFGGILYVDSLSPPEGPTPTYLKLLEHNIKTIVSGLQTNSNSLETPEPTN
jgi:manganese transport system substrate-binding protein